MKSKSFTKSSSFWLTNPRKSYQKAPFCPPPSQKNNYITANVFSFILNNLVICWVLVDQKFCILNSSDSLTSFFQTKLSKKNANFEKIEEPDELVDGSEEKNTKRGKSVEKETKSTKKNQHAELNQDPSEPEDENGDNGDQKDRDKKDQSKNIDTETDQSEDEESDLEEYSGDYSETDQADKKKEDIRKAKKKHYRTQEADDTEEEEAERPKLYRDTTSRSRSNREESEEMAQRSDEEKEILHNYYKEVGHSKAYHGSLKPGSVMKMFNKQEQKVIKRFLHQIGQKGRRARTRSQETHTEDQGESSPVRPSPKIESPEMAKRSNREKMVIRQYYHDIGKQRGEKTRKGSVIEKYRSEDQGIIRNFLHEIGSKGRKGRKIKGKDYNKRDIQLQRDQEEEEKEQPKTSKETSSSPQKMEEKIGKKKESDDEQPELETPKKRGRPRKSESAEKQKKMRKSLEKQRGDVEIKQAMQKVQDKQNKENESPGSTVIKIKVESEKEPKVYKTPFAQWQSN